MQISLEKIAEIINGDVKGDKNKLIYDVAPFENATDNDITYADNPKFLKRLNNTQAGAVIVPPAFEENTDKHLIKTKNPRIAFAKVVNLFYPCSFPERLISSNAKIGKNFRHGKNISVADFVFIGNNVSLGDNVIIYPHVFIDNDVEIGNDTLIYPNVTVLRQCKIGNRVIIHSGTVIGSDGFGFAPDREKYYKIPHIGIVCIEDDVEIGANNAIDRGTFGKTLIKKGVKTDNLVHIAHNVTVGENTLLIAQVGIAGSTSIGKHAILAGQAGISGHLTIGDNAVIGPQCGVGRDIADGETVSGSPEIAHKLWLRVQNIMPKLPEMKKKLAELEKKVNSLIEKNRNII